MVRNIVREEVTSVRDEVSVLREVVSSLRDEVPILREAVIGLREEVRSELQSFYERISTLIERSSTYPAPTPGPPPPPPPRPPSPPHAAFGLSSPPSHFPPPQTEKEVDDTVHASVDTPTTVHTAVDTPSALAGTDMVYFF